jgi:hypothetical protein
MLATKCFPSTQRIYAAANRVSPACGSSFIRPAKK